MWDTLYFVQESEVSHVKREAQALERIIMAQIPDRSTIGDLADWFYDFVIIAFAARILQVSGTEIDALRDACVKRVMAKADTEIEDATRNMNGCAKSLVKDMLIRMNDRRYDPAFQYVFALWPLAGVE
jgi:hypothetical protein